MGKPFFFGERPNLIPSTFLEPRTSDIQGIPKIQKKLCSRRAPPKKIDQNTMHEVTRIAIKALVVVVILLSCTFIVAIVTSKKEKFHCSFTIEQGISRALQTLILLLISGNEKFSQRKVWAAFHDVLRAKEIVNTLQTLYSETYLQSISTKAETRENEPLIMKLRGILEERISMEKDEMGITGDEGQLGSQGDTPSQATHPGKAVLWNDCFNLLHLLDAQIRRSGVKQLQLTASSASFLGMEYNKNSLIHQYQSNSPSAITLTAS